MDPRKFFVDQDIIRAQGLPKALFLDPEFHLRTQEIFKISWQFIPPPETDLRTFPELLAARGSWAPSRDRKLIITRDSYGTLHCFYNTCSHAGFPAVLFSGCGTHFECPQHGRKYKLTGEFASHTGLEEKMTANEKKSAGLYELNLGLWNQFFFVNASTAPPKLWDFIKDMHNVIGLLALNRFRRSGEIKEMERVPGSPFLHILNYLDELHITYIHGRSLAKAVDMKSYRTEIYPWSVLQWVFAENPQYGFDPQLLPERFRDAAKRVFALWWFIFPNMAFNFYPWGLSVNMWLPTDRNPETTIFYRHHYIWDNDKYAGRNEFWADSAVNEEDLAAIQETTRSIKNPSFLRQNKFLPDKEQAPHWFHRRLYELLFEERKTVIPR
ncbi:MAG: Rieske 2Fe-2S domain-containing protein [Candidatus Sungiibacteriota bacterium]|uniref:Rieske 2Fe-2S domain-containing protein n=1 Tax=Candidatus Sungiibacteriota bacterium TaxID=2750080 RepID=A0A7T5RJC7_9BACT|nr:MAG: Rieske 2Fe-2S domain-containing protein [Candidatus Sungbacteria bacterium]